MVLMQGRRDKIEKEDKFCLSQGDSEYCIPKDLEMEEIRKHDESREYPDDEYEEDDEISEPEKKLKKELERLE